MLSASELCPGVTEIPFCLGRSSFTLKQKGRPQTRTCPHKYEPQAAAASAFGLRLNIQRTQIHLHIEVEQERCTSAKSLLLAQQLSVRIKVVHRFLHERRQSGRGVPGPGIPKVRDEMHWQAQVVRLNTFGASTSDRHPVVIHQHMCQNASPSLNIVSAEVWVMHGRI